MLVFDNKFSDLPIRALSAFVLSTLVLSALYFGTMTSLMLLVVCASILFFEMMSVSFEKKFYFNFKNSLLIVIFSSFPIFQFLNAVPFLILFIGCLLNIIFYGINFFRVFHIFYFGISIFAFQKLLFGDGGLISIHGLFFVVVIVIASDIGGYVFGRSIGGPKLVLSISPKKTWAGAIGGILLANLISVAIVPEFYFTAGWLFLMTSLLSIVSQLGDIFQSYFKRYFNVKDSGSILPGHGGLYDRLDGLLAAAPVYYFMTLYYVSS